MKKIISVLLSAAIVLMSTVCFANSVDTATYDADANEITVAGFADILDSDGYPITSNGNAVAIKILKPDVTEATISDPFDLSQFEYLGQLIPGAKGEYKLSYNPKDFGIGYNTVVVSFQSGESIYKNILLVDREEKNTLLGDLNGAANTDAMLEAINKHDYLWNTDAFKYMNATYPDAEMNKKIAGLLVGERFTSLDDVIDKMAKATVVAGINEATTSEEARDLIVMFSRELDINDSPVYNMLYLSIADSISGAFVGQNYKSGGAFLTDFNETVILTRINTATNYIDIEYIVANASDYLKGANFDKFASLTGTQKNAVVKKLGNTYTSIAEFVKAFNAAIVDVINSGEGKPQGGGGGSGSPTGSGFTPSSGSGPVTFDSSAEKDPDTGFTDLAGYEWAKPAIAALFKWRIVNGKSDKLFAPGDNVAREEFVKMLMLGFDIPVSHNALPFTDVDMNEWYYPYISGALDNGIANGISDTQFGIGISITREDLATMAYRVASGKSALKNTDSSNKFGDDSKISDYAKDAVYALKNAGVINGDENGNFNPKSYASRAEAAKILYGLLSIGG